MTRLYLHTSVSGYTCMQAYLGGNTKRGNWVVPDIDKISATRGKSPFLHTLLIFHSHQKFAYLTATRICMACISFLLKIPLYKRFHTFFGDFTPFFHTFFKIFFHHINRLPRRYKNIYALHRFPIENSSI